EPVEHAKIEGGEADGAVVRTGADDAQLGFDALLDQPGQRFDRVFMPLFPNEPSDTQHAEGPLGRAGNRSLWAVARIEVIGIDTADDDLMRFVRRAAPLQAAPPNALAAAVDHIGELPDVTVEI